MNRILVLIFFLYSNANGAEVEKCLDQEIVFRSALEAPLVTELKEGSVAVSAIVGKDGEVKSTEILSQEGDIRWGDKAIKAMTETKFKPGSKACEFEYVYTAKFDTSEKEN